MFPDKNYCAIRKFAVIFTFLSVIIVNNEILAELNDYSLRGYIRETPILWKPSPVYSGTDNADYRFDNLLHGRLNVRWYPGGNFTLGLELKTRLYAGDSAGEIRESAEGYTFSKPYFDWSVGIIEEDNIVWTGDIDRCWLDWYSGSLQITVGRQRIAWGTNTVWNPVDLFNPSSPLDFDNEEKPGSDGARAQYYLGPTSKIEFAYTPGKDDSDESTAALLIMLNRWEYDFFFISGIKRGETVFGTAWAGNIMGGGFTGEILYSIPGEEKIWQVDESTSIITDDNPYLTASVSGNYTFKNSLSLQADFLYNERGTTGDAGGMNLYQSFLQGDLTPARWSLAGQISRDLHPLVRSTLMGLYNPNDKSWYFGPTVSWSVITNLDFTALGLIFGGDEGTEFGDNSEILMLRLKWSF